MSSAYSNATKVAAGDFSTQVAGNLQMKSPYKMSHTSANEEKQPLLQPDTPEIRPSPLSEFLSKFYVPLVIVYYTAVSSSMLVVNKVAVYYVPLPSCLLFIQLGASALIVGLLGACRLVTVEPWEWAKIRKFLGVVLGFVGVIFCNMNVLKHANVETFITFRSSVPLVISWFDYFFLGRDLPPLQSWICMAFLLLGAIGYVMFDSAFKVTAYTWLAVWYAFFTFDAVYIKHVCQTVPMTDWTRVFLTNLLALPPLAFIIILLNEWKDFLVVSWTEEALIPLVLSCFVGLGMSHATYLLRDAVSATAFTVVGIVCKIFTVIINCMIWDNHASPVGIGFLLVCLFAGTFYRQAPMRQSANQPK